MKTLYKLRRNWFKSYFVSLFFLLLCMIPIFKSHAGIVTGPIVNPNNGHSYYLLTQNTWTDSEAEAVSLGGHLATIRDSAENEWVLNTFSMFGGAPKTLWIGLRDIDGTGNFAWISGEDSPYRNWSSGEPNNIGVERFAHIYDPSRPARFVGKWNNFSDGTVEYGIPLYGVVEVLPNNPPKITSFMAYPRSGVHPLDVNFQCTAEDFDGSVVRYRWNYGDGSSDTTTIGQSTHTYVNVGTFNVRVTAVDNDGARKTSNAIAIKVANGPEIDGKCLRYVFDDIAKSVTLRIKVTNNGDVPTVPFDISFHLSDNGTTPLVPAFKTLTIPDGLPSKKSAYLTTSHTFADSMYGKFILIYMDSSKQVAETDESNNGIRLVVQPMTTE